jgi:hypothetical protein
MHTFIHAATWAPSLPTHAHTHHHPCTPLIHVATYPPPFPPPSPLLPPPTHTPHTQVSPLVVAVDGVLIEAVRAMVTRVISKLESCAPPSGTAPEPVTDRVDPSTLSPVIPWYVERLVLKETALRLTIWPRGVWWEPMAFLVTIVDAPLLFGDVSHVDVLLPLDQLLSTVRPLVQGWGLRGGGGARASRACAHTRMQKAPRASVARAHGMFVWLHACSHAWMPMGRV